MDMDIETLSKHAEHSGQLTVVKGLLEWCVQHVADMPKPVMDSLIEHLEQFRAPPS